MLYSNCCFVVEGSNDASYLSSLIEAEYVVTNGYDIPEEEIEYLKELSKYKQIVVLSDSDQAGKTIREKLNTLINCTNVEFDIAKTKPGEKHGVAETFQNEILEKLHTFCVEKSSKCCVFSLCDYNELISNSEERKLICSILHLGNCNTKKFIERCNNLHINKERVKEAKNGN